MHALNRSWSRIGPARRIDAAGISFGMLGILLSLSCLLAPGRAFADGDGESCSTPQALVAGNDYNGNTENDEDAIENVGPVPSPANDHIYAFTADASSGFVNVIYSNYEYVVYLVSSCDGPDLPAPLSAVSDDSPGVLAFSGLTVGQTYYLIVSGAAAGGAGANGIYSLYMPIASSTDDDGGLSCAAAEPLLPGRTYTGNTLFANDVINNFGGVFASPATDEIYSFSPDDLGNFIYVDSADFDFGVFVTSSCSAQTGPVLDYATGNAPSFVDISLLTPGQTYYLIVSGDPGASVDAEGEYSLSTLPASETIFNDGFDGRP